MFTILPMFFEHVHLRIPNDDDDDDDDHNNNNNIVSPRPGNTGLMSSGV